MKSHEIRQTFVKHFQDHGHTPVTSSSTVPENDATLLFTNAGMNQFKNVFLGSDLRDYKRAVTVQKCIRAGGKHNDLDSVGKTARHHTFFEMMGNFSFGDYFKVEAIEFAWSLLTQKLHIDPKRLYVTVFQDDDEAETIWHKHIGLSKDKIFRFGEKDNFWRMGETGPCGPCSEIFFDHGELPGENPDPYKNILAGGDRFVEIWNLVFMQFDESRPGVLEPLPNPSIDTGGGLERWAAALQGEPNNYHTDLFMPLIAKASEISKRSYNKNQAGLPDMVAMRVLADHSRTASFLIADGVMPSNEGRGYVLRRIMRRAIRFGQTICPEGGIFAKVASLVPGMMGQGYPELKAKADLIDSTLEKEENQFLSTLETGSAILQAELEKLGLRGQKTLPGAVSFKLYDTFGFPVDLTEIMCQERGVSLDLEDFQRHMESAKETARASRGKSKSEGGEALAAFLSKLEASAVPKTEFIGHSQTELLEPQKPLFVLNDLMETVPALNQGQTGTLIFAKTPFYPEGGGQIGDRGEVVQGSTRVQVLDTQKWVHHIALVISVETGTLSATEPCLQKVDATRRQETAAHHSATHLLQRGLRRTLGETVSQAGSAVYPDRLRFDFHFQRALTQEERNQVESWVNSEIAKGHPTRATETSKDKALAMGALAMFGEKYGDTVRVLKIGSESVELCGGTHVQSTSDIRAFLIVSETGVSSGVRRIEAIAGQKAMETLFQNRKDLLQVSDLAGVQVDQLEKWVMTTKTQLAETKKNFEKLQRSSVDSKTLADKAGTVNSPRGDIQLLLTEVPSEDRKFLADLCDELIGKLGKRSLVVLIGDSGQANQKALFVAVGEELKAVITAPAILKGLPQKFSVKGGGKPHLAQGSIGDFKETELRDALKAVLGTP